MFETIYSVLSWVLTSIGMYMILEKCGRQGKFWAFVPGVRYYRIAELPDRESDGIMVIIFEILSYSLSFVPTKGKVIVVL